MPLNILHTGKINFSWEESLVFLVKGAGCPVPTKSSKMHRIQGSRLSTAHTRYIVLRIPLERMVTFIILWSQRSTEFYYLCSFYALFFQGRGMSIIFLHLCCINIYKKINQILDLAINFCLRPNKIVFYGIIINNCVSIYN